MSVLMTAPTVGPDLRPMFRGALSLEPLVIQNRHPELKADRLGDARNRSIQVQSYALIRPSPHNLVFLSKRLGNLRS